jgi:hypothetical protein
LRDEKQSELSLILKEIREMLSHAKAKDGQIKYVRDSRPQSVPDEEAKRSQNSTLKKDHSKVFGNVEKVSVEI